MWWTIASMANALVGVAYLLIALAIVRPLVKAGQLRSNRLGAATAAIFFTCAVHHGAHTLHMVVLPYLGLAESQGLAMRATYSFPSATWDVISAAVGIYYWTLRRTYGSLMEGAKLFEDMQQRERQALELNDNVLQGLVVAKLALDLDERDKAYRAVETAISSASGMITELLGVQEASARHSLVRRRAAEATAGDG
jgi:signal transduction histidine kinase